MSNASTTLSCLPSATAPLVSAYNPLPRVPSQANRYFIGYAVGGSLVVLQPPTSGVNQKGGGQRGQVKGFSRQSQKRFRDLGNSIDLDSITPRCVLNITHTYPGAFPMNKAQWRRHLNCLCKRWKRRWGPCAVIWKLEFQRRGAPHWHLVAFANHTMAGALPAFCQWLQETWHAICGAGDPDHLRWGTKVTACLRRSDVDRELRYLAKNDSKPKEKEVVDTGRQWGAWHKELLPIRMEYVEVSRKGFMKVRRTIYRCAKQKRPGPLRTVKLYVRHRGVTDRVLEAVSVSDPLPNTEQPLQPSQDVVISSDDIAPTIKERLHVDSKLQLGAGAGIPVLREPEPQVLGLSLGLGSRPAPIGTSRGPPRPWPAAGAVALHRFWQRRRP